ncbi:enoyl-CoA hydratase/isomerase family protein [Stutzerimonas stutzeri]|uniref:enoyl-CoA hydratase/isomerase family protein n=1 Tax=Stutzerimonas stutzeri TaxID=316 RepID=UPI003C6EF14A
MYRAENGIGRLTLNRPERHNALVPELLEDLGRALDQCRQDLPPYWLSTLPAHLFSPVVTWPVCTILREQTGTPMPAPWQAPSTR